VGGDLEGVIEAIDFMVLEGAEGHLVWERGPT
jgi:hypothetical protein